MPRSDDDSSLGISMSESDDGASSAPRASAGEVLARAKAAALQRRLNPKPVVEAEPEPKKPERNVATMTREQVRCHPVDLNSFH
jgi:hypothetical protein